MSTCTTTNYLTQLPGELNLKMVDDNDFVFAVNWGMDITGYLWSANIVPESLEDEIAMGVVVTSASSGKMNIIISASSIADISPSTNDWYLNWTTPSPDSYVRTVLSGKLVLLTK